MEALARILSIWCVNPGINYFTFLCRRINDGLCTFMMPSELWRKKSLEVVILTDPSLIEF